MSPRFCYYERVRAPSCAGPVAEAEGLARGNTPWESLEGNGAKMCGVCGFSHWSVKGSFTPRVTREPGLWDAWVCDYNVRLAGRLHISSITREPQTQDA